MEQMMQSTLRQILLKLPEGQQMKIIVIDGMCAGGKTTLADALAKELQAPVIRMDDFFLPFDLRSPQRLQQPGGNIHYERFEEEVLPFIGNEGPFRYRKFHCHDGHFSPLHCPESRMRIVEGSYSLHPRFLPAWQAVNALKVFVNTDNDEQLRRIAHRNPELVDAFREKWIPMENNYFSAFGVADAADVRITT